MPQVSTATSSQVDLYLRLSNADESADSLARQEADLREWVEREGLTVRQVWSDYGRSGYKREVQRDGFDSALTALANGDVSTLAVWKLDRLSRRGAGHVGTILDDLDESGGSLVFLKDGLDTTNSTSRFLIVTLSEIPRSESANTSVRVHSRKAADRRAGRYLGGSAPSGYSVTDARLLRPNDAPLPYRGQRSEFDLMRELVQRVSAGDSLLAVARDWNTSGVPTRRGGLWRSSTLSNALRSPTLCGLMTEMVRERTPEGRAIKSIRAYRNPDTGEHISIMAPGCDPIATPAEQARVLFLMEGKYRKYGRGAVPVRMPRSLLGTLAVCAGCGRKLTTFGDSYRCKRSFVDGSTCPAPVSASVEVLDDAVRRAWARRLAAIEHDSDLLQRVGSRWLERFDPAALHEHRELREGIADVEERLRQAADDHYVKGTLNETLDARVSTRLGERLTALRTQLAMMPSPEADLGALLDPELALPAIEAAPVAEARDLLRLVIASVHVSRAERRGARFDPLSRLTFDWAE